MTISRYTLIINDKKTEKVVLTKKSNDNDYIEHLEEIIDELGYKIKTKNIEYE